MTDSWIAFGSIASSIGVATGLIMAAVSVRNFRKQLQVQVLLEYTRRYETVMERFPHNVRKQGIHNLSAADAAQDQYLSPFLNYVNLCSEEFYLNRKSMIDKTAWEVWDREMQANLCSEFGAAGWKHLKDAGHYASYGEFTVYVDGLLEGRGLSAAASSTATS